MNRVSRLLPVLMLLLARHATAATVVTNNTGLNPATFVFLNYEGQAGTTPVGGVGNMVSTRGGTFGNDGDVNAFGELAAYASSGAVTYNFTELVAGQTYKIYGNWYGNGINNCAFTVTGNAISLGTYSQLNNSAAGATGFTAYEEATDPAGEAKGFVLLGTVVADGNGDIAVTTSLGNLAFFRNDAIAVVAVPEPSALISASAGLLALAMLRRR